MRRGEFRVRRGRVSQPHPLADLKMYNRGAPPLFFQFSKEPMNAEDMASIMAHASCDE